MKPVAKSHLMLAVMLMGMAPAWGDDQDRALALRKSGDIRGLENILQTALSIHPQARVLEVELEREHGRYRYEVELVTAAGDVRELEFDAHDGRLLSDEEDD